MADDIRPPVPPFTYETAVQKVRMAEDGWNSRDAVKVSGAYTENSRWRNRAEFVNGRDEIVAFLKRKWAQELDYRLIKEIWAFGDNRIAVRFAYEWHDDSGHWFRSYGNENWEFDQTGRMAVRHASHQRPADHRGGAQVPLAARPAPRRPPRAHRARPLTLSRKHQHRSSVPVAHTRRRQIHPAGRAIWR